MVGFVYPNSITQFYDGSYDWAAANTLIKVMLLDNGHTPAIDETAVTNLATDELSGTGYTGGFGGSGRKAVANAAANHDTGNDRAEMDGDNVTWTAINAGTITYVAVIQEDTNDAGSHPICIFDDNEITNLPLTTNGGDVTLTWNVEGIFQIS